MQNLKSIILIPLKIKRKGLVPPILLMLFFFVSFDCGSGDSFSVCRR